MSDALAMPDNLQACQTLVEQLVITVAELELKNAELTDKHLAQQLEIAYLIKLAFQRRSERYLEDPNQLKLDLGNSDEAHDAAEGLQDAKQEQAAADELIIAEHVRKKQSRAKKPRNEQLPAGTDRRLVAAALRSRSAGHGRTAALRSARRARNHWVRRDGNAGVCPPAIESPCHEVSEVRLPQRTRVRRDES